MTFFLTFTWELGASKCQPQDLDLALSFTTSLLFPCTSLWLLVHVLPLGWVNLQAWRGHVSNWQMGTIDQLKNNLFAKKMSVTFLGAFVRCVFGLRGKIWVSLYLSLIFSPTLNTSGKVEWFIYQLFHYLLLWMLGHAPLFYTHDLRTQM